MTHARKKRGLSGGSEKVTRPPAKRNATASRSRLKGTEQAAAFRKGKLRDRSEDITLESFCDDWLATKSPEIRYGSKELYQATIDRLIGYFGPDKLLSKVTPIDAARFIAELKPQRRDLQGKELSGWTRHRELRNCKTMFQSAVTWKLTSKNPFKDVKAPKLIITPWHYVKPKE